MLRPAGGAFFFSIFGFTGFGLLASTFFAEASRFLRCSAVSAGLGLALAGACLASGSGSCGCGAFGASAAALVAAFLAAASALAMAQHQAPGAEEERVVR